MKVVVFGASGMVGQGVVRECRLDPDVTEIVSVVRAGTGVSDAKLREAVHRDFTDFEPLAGAFAGADACFFCLGVSGAGMKEDAYRRVTYDFTLAAGHTLFAANPGLTFIYVSGQGTNTTGRAMWARVKGETEDALFALSPNAYAFRPGFIRPMHGARSKTGTYRLVYAMAKPLYPVLGRLSGSVTSTEQVARAMLAIAKDGYPKRILENRDINAAS